MENVQAVPGKERQSSVFSFHEKGTEKLKLRAGKVLQLLYWVFGDRKTAIYAKKLQSMPSVPNLAAFLLLLNQFKK